MLPSTCLPDTLPHRSALGEPGLASGEEAVAGFILSAAAPPALARRDLYLPAIPSEMEANTAAPQGSIVPASLDMARGPVSSALGPRLGHFSRQVGGAGLLQVSAGRLDPVRSLPPAWRSHPPPHFPPPPYGPVSISG